ncbi:DnaA/Hda family protein [Gluconobacter wancherniae]|uniref:Chromosomal replication initiator protein DnaA n=1 Tax=Gluconobacter wancherniae NBRC 103581 TaxID=656744 RepID=A0A511AYX4_9PROT|nr:DnaA/Hda family protein [Gluconobacter wancherniae]MBF0852986.1 chromosomal replication initiator DnaA [Gluconobacter wancherniae]MBS1061669.1 chromosomal replication initiator DnaA [Gluconobacter wancherniae]MBS1087873.1 chromosomal replication initiator DnaA [Gluconobacter wancherniae]MBS1093555.1 chromosomal replication initiator DnaA [Gluconobacter wancherniae]GBD56297.1 chromosomal replication initiator protein DnaA [Gluconobacter wancherniae NBRC 103581]
MVEQEIGKTIPAEQLVLGLQRSSALTVERFIPGPSNAAARAWIARPHWPDQRLWLWGPSGTGKTHLLSMWATKHNATVVDARLFVRSPGARLQVQGNLAIDNADSPADEVTMLHLLNDAHSHAERVLMVGRLPPSRTHFMLPDLASRLRATATTATGEPEDALRATLLLSLLADRQLVVSQPVTDWLWRHLPRTGKALVCAVEQLDQAALARGVPITRALAQEVLADLLTSDI